jgi:hypothetical protein
VRQLHMGLLRAAAPPSVMPEMRRVLAVFDGGGCCVNASMSMRPCSCEQGWLLFECEPGAACWGSRLAGLCTRSCVCRLLPGGLAQPEENRNSNLATGLGFEMYNHNGTPLSRRALPGLERDEVIGIRKDTVSHGPCIHPDPIWDPLYSISHAATSRMLPIRCP